MRKFDFLTPFGMILGLALIYAAILITGSNAGVKIFISVSSMITVFGGLTASLMVNYSSEDISSAFGSIKDTFYCDKKDISELVDLFVRLTTIARREGLLALENKVDEVEDPFIRKGVLLTVDGIEAEKIKDVLSTEIIALEEKKNVGINVIEKAGELSPAWGMIGTLIGLILMLLNLNDSTKIGATLALALVTTFYGSVLANLFFIPMAGKMRNRLNYEIYIKHIIIEGVLGVQSGMNPKLLRDKLDAFLDTKESKLGELISKTEEVAY